MAANTASTASTNSLTSNQSHSTEAEGHGAECLTVRTRFEDYTTTTPPRHPNFVKAPDSGIVSEIFTIQ
jgi:hypothetical protein